MAGKTVSFNTHCNLYYSNLETIAKWLSCNGEVWGVGPTAVFASAAALFLFNELEASIFMVGDHLHVSLLEKTMVSTMVLGMLALMIHLWVCSMRFFQYYLDTLIKDSPNVLLEMTTAGLLGGQEMVALGPLTRFLRMQQPLIHITICWFLSLCYADYVRKHYCQSFNLPYLEQWQAELQERAARQARAAVERAQSCVAALHRRLRGFTHRPPPDTVRAYLRRRRWKSVGPAAASGRSGAEAALPYCEPGPRQSPDPTSCACGSSVNRAKLLLMGLRNSEVIFRRPGVTAKVRRTPASMLLTLPPPRNYRLENFIQTTDDTYLPICSLSELRLN